MFLLLLAMLCHFEPLVVEIFETQRRKILIKVEKISQSLRFFEMTGTIPRAQPFGDGHCRTGIIPRWLRKWYRYRISRIKSAPRIVFEFNRHNLAGMLQLINDDCVVEKLSYIKE